jgi:glycosyltransferase involved in cell wall biosynthesis
MPKFSIITSALNVDSTIERCVDSVKSQSFRDYEHIIVDGESKDSTVDCIKSLGYDKLFWISEKDQGIYDAWNKGLRISRGDWVLFLGADDYMLNDKVLEDISEHILLSPNKFGFISTLVEKEESVIDSSNELFRDWLYRNNSPYDEIVLNMPPNPGLFYSRKLFEHAQFDESYKYGADKKFFLSFLGKASIQIIEIKTVFFSLGGTTNQQGNKVARWKEKNRINNELGYTVLHKLSWVTFLKCFLKDLFFKIRNRLNV